MKDKSNMPECVAPSSPTNPALSMAIRDQGFELLHHELIDHMLFVRR